MTSPEWGPPIRRAVVLGAGVMGAQIAAHLANAGVACDLLDMVPAEPTPEEAARGLGLSDRAVRNRLATDALARLRRLRPSPLFADDSLALLRPGNFEDDLERVREADWVIEAIVERLEPKRALWARVEPLLPEGAVASTNTSGIPIRDIAANFGPGLARRFLGTHFFNPPRYLPLVELIPGPATDPDALARVERFLSARLGKEVVLARDTPNFIANRVGTYGLQVVMEEMAARGLSVDEVDAITGPAMGRPKSATFRTLDVVGLDTYVHVADNIRDRVDDPEERRVFAVPEVVRAMLERGWLGQKSGQGFYRKVTDEASGSRIETLDLSSMEYRPRSRPRFPSVGAALKEPDPASRLRVLLSGDDTAAAFAWAITSRLFAYAARILPEIADDADAVDRAMRGGFGWALGPFESWETLGFAKTARRMRDEGLALPAWVEERIAGGAAAPGGAATGRAASGGASPVGAPALSRLRRECRERPVWSEPDATLLDLGEGVACLALHGEKDALGPGTVAAIHRALDDVERGWRGLVLAGCGENFCVGANILLILMAARAGAWDQVDEAVRAFQGVNMRMKYFAKPLVTAIHGMVLGGGAEVALHSPVVQAAAETYVGLVETGVGLIPGGGGTKERWLGALDGVPADAPLDLNPLAHWVFESIALAKVGTSALDSRRLGYMRPGDGLSMNRERILADARRRVALLDEEGFRPAVPRPVPVPGREGRAQLALAIDEMLRAGRISPHDARIAGALADVLCGGDVAAGTLLPEEDLLDLERDRFLSLAGEPLSQARMAHMLQTGKPLRN